MKHTIIRNILYAVLLGATLIASGCATTYTPPDYSQYYWPKEPMKPRLRLVNIIRTDLDIREISQTESMFGERAQFAFKKPNGIVADNEGNIYVTDTYRKQVFSINPGTGSIKRFQKPGGWLTPFGLGIDTVNNIIAVSDGGLVAMFDYKTGRLIRQISGQGFRSVGDVAFDPVNRYMYIVDTKGSAVYKYDYNGKRLSTVATIGAGEQNVYYPAAADVDSEGRLFICDTMNWRIKIFDKDGNYIRGFGSHGSMPGQFNRPKGISISKDGVIAITDNDLGLFMLMNDKGQTYTYLGKIGKAPAMFANPTGIYVDDKDMIYVVDQTNRRLQIYQMYTDKYYEENPGTLGGEKDSTPAEAAAPATDEKPAEAAAPATDEKPAEDSPAPEDAPQQPAAEEPQGTQQQ